MQMQRNHTLWLIVLILGCIVCDLFSKLQIITHLEMGEVREVTSFFNIVLVVNKGIGFSLFNSIQNGNILLLVINSFITLVLFFWFLKEKELLSRLALTLIVGGAAGNLLDRISYGGVVDFLDFHLGSKHWPAFNLADSFVCIGAFLLILSLIKSKGASKS